MKKLLILVFSLLLMSGNFFAQEEKKIDVQFHGFVKVDYFFDSRQTVNAREGHFLLFPAAAQFDANGEDINAGPNFNILAIQTRLKTSITGPDFFNAKSSAFIEGAFFGHSNSDINGFRLRHAFVKLKWDNTELLMGQYWHPMFVTACFPGVYSFNTGAPFQPFSRNPQIRLTYGNKFKILGTLYGQRDFASRGPAGTSSQYLRNSGFPAANLQLQFASGSFFGGAGVDFKAIKPVLTTAAGLKYEDNLPALSYLAFLKLKSNNFQFKCEATYGENMADLLMLGGIADHLSESNQFEYSNFTSFAVWTELSTSVKKMEFGLFGGYSQNLGIEKTLHGESYALGGNIASIWRVSLRSAWKSGATKLGLELERTDAQYGTIASGETTVDIDGIDPVSNYRLLFFAMYSF